MCESWETEEVVWKLSDSCHLRALRQGCYSILIIVLPPSFLVTVFDRAVVFNGDLSQWDVASVTRMPASKSIRVVVNEPTRLELMLL
jgi:hypothetical protein